MGSYSKVRKGEWLGHVEVEMYCVRYAGVRGC